MGGPTLRDAVGTADAERFVGRDAELDLVRDLLSARSPSRVLFVHGPGGIGKSALLRAAGRVAEAAGFVVSSTDARTLSTEPDRASDAVARGSGRRRCFVIDEADALGSSLGPLRDRLLDSLDDSARLVVAGRRGPDRSWREGGLDAVLLDVPLRPLSDDDAGALLRSRGVDRERVAGIVEWAQGSPLALTVAASAPAGRPVQGSAELEQRLTAWLAGQPMLDVPQDVLEVAAIARAVDARLLRAALPGRSARDGMAQLLALPVAERVGDAVALHAVLAAAIRARLRTSEPKRESELVRRIAEHLATRARLGDMGALVSLSRLIESPQVRAMIGNEPSSTSYADAVRPGELARFGHEHGFDQGPDWQELVEWIGRESDRTLVMRRVGGEAVMFASFVPVGALGTTAAGAITSSLIDAAERTDADARRSFAGVVLFADAAATEIAEAARLGTGAFMLQRGVGDTQSMLIHYPAPDRRPPTTSAIAREVPGVLPRAVAISDFRPAGVVGMVEAVVLGEHGFTQRRDDAAALLTDDEDPVRIARLRARLDEVFGPSEADRRLRQAIELVHLGSRSSEQECLDVLHVSRRSWYRLLRTARERVLAG